MNLVRGTSRNLMKANRRCSLNLVQTGPEHLMNTNEVKHEFGERDNVKISKK